MLALGRTISTLGSSVIDAEMMMIFLMSLRMIIQMALSDECGAASGLSAHIGPETRVRADVRF